MSDGDSDDPEVVTQFLDPLTVRARARVGQMLRNKWPLDVLLGVGGMAAVYAATHIKMLHHQGYVANAVDHPGLMCVLDDDAAGDGSLLLVAASPLSAEGGP
jgi:hypothetical protein